MQMTCHDFEERLSADDVLLDDAREHVEQCTACAALMRALRDVDEHLPRLREAEAPTALQIEQRVLEQRETMRAARLGPVVWAMAGVGALSLVVMVGVLVQREEPVVVAALPPLAAQDRFQVEVAQKAKEQKQAEVREKFAKLFAGEGDGVGSLLGGGARGSLAGTLSNVLGGSQTVSGNESYAPSTNNGFKNVGEAPVATFSIDVDTASYANVRRFVNAGQLPPKDAVRLEELINYFPYETAPPTGKDPIALHTEVSTAPWQPEHKLVRVALRARDINQGNRPSSNLVFLIDVSGSMSDANKLPLVKAALLMLVEQLTANDSVGIVVYAGGAGVVLEPTRGSAQQEIRAAIEQLQTGGSTHGSAGLAKAYALAKQHYIKGGTNRVILATDGDFNVGTTGREELLSLIQTHAKTGVFLTALGVGMGNYKDDTMELLADKGNGNYAYLDSLREARKVLIEQMSGTLVTVAKDVKIQVEFNPTRVGSYRLLGYENRLLARKDFEDDQKDAGEMGASHVVTALYEVVALSAQKVAPLRYQQAAPVLSEAAGTQELLHVKLRYKLPEGTQSVLMEKPVLDGTNVIDDASADMRFATSVALFGMGLRGDLELAALSDASKRYPVIERLANRSLGQDPHGHRKDFVELVGKAKRLDVSAVAPTP